MTGADGAGGRADSGPAGPDGTDGPAGPDRADVAALLAGASPEVLARTVLAVAAMHEPDSQGRCRWCRPGRWGRRSAHPCPTRRMMVAELRTPPPAR